MIPKGGYRFSEKDHAPRISHRPMIDVDVVAEQFEAQMVCCAVQFRKHCVGLVVVPTAVLTAPTRPLVRLWHDPWQVPTCVLQVIRQALRLCPGSVGTGCGIGKVAPPCCACDGAVPKVTAITTEATSVKRSRIEPSFELCTVVPARAKDDGPFRFNRQACAMAV